MAATELDACVDEDVQPLLRVQPGHGHQQRPAVRHAELAAHLGGRAARAIEGRGRRRDQAHVASSELTDPFCQVGGHAQGDARSPCHHKLAHVQHPAPPGAAEHRVVPGDDQRRRIDPPGKCEGRNQPGAQSVRVHDVGAAQQPSQTTSGPQVLGRPEPGFHFDGGERCADAGKGEHRLRRRRAEDGDVGPSRH